MPHFFIHIADEEGHQIDDIGCEAADLEAIKTMTRYTAAQIICHEVMAGKLNVELVFYIEDAARVRLATLPVSATIQEYGAAT